MFFRFGFFYAVKTFHKFSGYFEETEIHNKYINKYGWVKTCIQDCSLEISWQIVTNTL